MMNEKTASPNYLMVLIWLTIVTVIEVGAVFFDMPRSVLIAFLLITAFIKALLVALYFMHLKFEGWLMWTVILSPLVIAPLYLLILFPDIVIGYWR
jgi:cytochrome c oxidase subunit 4